MTNPQNYITEDTTIKGSITTASSLTIAGAIEGDVNAGGEITVLDDAFVKGDVSGPNIKILGQVEGRVNATGRLEISSSGQVVGDISVRALHIEEGGTLEGECKMGGNGTTTANTKAARPTSTAPVGTPRPAPSNLPPPGGG